MQTDNPLKIRGLSHVPSAKSTYIYISSSNEENHLSFYIPPKFNNFNKPQKLVKTQNKYESPRKLLVTQANKQTYKNEILTKKPLSLGKLRLDKQIIQFNDTKINNKKTQTSQVSQNIIKKKLDNNKMNMQSPLKMYKKDLNTKINEQIIKSSNIKNDKFVKQHNFLRLGKKLFIQTQSKNTIHKIFN